MGKYQPEGLGADPPAAGGKWEFGGGAAAIFYSFFQKTRIFKHSLVSISA